MDYSYPDHEDKLVTAFIEKAEPYGGYWQESEENILRVVKKHIENNLDNFNNLLDVGCGEGRLFDWFKEFNHIVALDADNERLETAESNAVRLGIENKVSFCNCLFNDFEEGENIKFDVILCSHVIQHIHTDDLPIFFAKFNQLLKENGLLIITTCHSTKGHNYYTKTFMEKEKPREKIISQEEFNSLITNKVNITPVHSFTIGSLLDLFPPNFKIIDIRVFHCIEKGLNFLHLFKIKDRFINMSRVIQNRFGRDVLVIARKEF